MADTFPTDESFDPVATDTSNDEFEVYEKDQSAPYRVSRGSKDAFLYLAGASLDPPMEFDEIDPDFLTQNDLESMIRQSKYDDIGISTRNRVSEAAMFNDLSGIQQAVADGDLRSKDVQADSSVEINFFLDKETSAIENRITKATYSLSKKISERIAEDTGPGYEDTFITWGGVGDLVDMIVSGPFQALTGLPWWQSEAAQKWKSAVANGAPQEEIEAYENEVVRVIADIGLLTETNRFMLMSLDVDFKEGGKGFESDLNKAFGIVDIAGVVAGAPKIAKGAYNLTRVARAAGKIAEATKVVTKGVMNPEVGAKVGVVEETTISALKLPVTNYDEIAAPGVAISKQGAVFQKIKDVINSYRKINPVNLETLRSKIPAITREVTKEVGRMMKNVNLADVRVLTPDRHGNIIAEAIVGTKEGAPIRNKLAAQGRAKAIGHGATIEKLTDEEAWYVKIPVRVGQNLALDEVTPEVLNKTIGAVSRLLNGTLSSVRDLPARLDALAKQAEGVIEPFIGKIKKDIEKQIKGLKADDLDKVDSIFRDLRDGVDSHLRQAWSVEEFATKFHTKFSRLPTEAEKSLYQNIQALNDVNYELKAISMMNTAANERFVWFADMGEYGDVARYSDFNTLGRTDPVVNLNDNSILTKDGQGAGQLKDTMAVLELENAIILADGTRTRYVLADSVNVRRSFPADYLAYNPGGVRDYAGTYRYVAKQDNNGDLLSVMGARSEKDAQAGARDINAIIDAVVKADPDLGVDNITNAGTIRRLKNLIDNEEVDAAIKNNSGWNPAVTNVKELVKWMEEGNNLRFAEKVGVAGWDDPVRFTKATGAGDNLTLGRTYGETMFRSWNRPRNSTRADRPLYGYGNMDLELSSPIDTIVNDSMRTLHADAFRAYDEQAARGTLARAKELVGDKSEVERAERVSVLKGVEVAYDQLKRMNNPGKDHRTYMVALKRILMQRDMKNGTQRLWEGVTARLAEVLWDRGNKGISKWMHNIAAQSRANPVDWLRSRNFAMRLGFFDPSQLIVQTAHIWNIVAISPKYGLEGAIQAIPMKLYTEARTAAQRELVLKKAAIASSVPIDELREIYEFVRMSGRAEVGAEVAEHGGMVSTSIRASKSGTDKVLNAMGTIERAGLITFNVGESLPRTAALWAAIREFKKNFPNVNIMSDEATLKIIRRQDVLSGMMTRTSSGTLNRSGTLALPLQFLSYSMRMTETMLRGDLTKAEKLRLFGAQIGFWGAGGVGFAQIMDGFALDQGREITEQEYLILRNGLLGEMYNYAVGLGGGRLDISNRLQIGEGIMEAIRGAGQDSFIETFTGPGGQLVNDMFTSLLKGMYNVYHGNLNTTRTSVLETVRNISSFNRAYRSYTTFYYGMYLSKKGEVATSGLSGREALGVLLGATPVEVIANWDAKLFLDGKREFVKETKANLKALKVQVALALEDGDTEKVSRLFDEMAFFAMLLREAGEWDHETVQDALKSPVDKTTEILEEYGRKNMEKGTPSIGTKGNYGRNN